MPTLSLIRRSESSWTPSTFATERQDLCSLKRDSNCSFGYTGLLWGSVTASAGAIPFLMRAITRKYGTSNSRHHSEIDCVWPFSVAEWTWIGPDALRTVAPVSRDTTANRFSLALWIAAGVVPNSAATAYQTDGTATEVNNTKRKLPRALEDEPGSHLRRQVPLGGTTIPWSPPTEPDIEH